MSTTDLGLYLSSPGYGAVFSTCWGRRHFGKLSTGTAVLPPSLWPLLHSKGCSPDHALLWCCTALFVGNGRTVWQFGMVGETAVKSTTKRGTDRGERNRACAEFTEVTPAAAQ